MKVAIVCCAILGLAALGSAFSISGIIGSVGSLAQFELYNKDSGDVPLVTLKAAENFIGDNVEEFMTYFDSDKETKILIHGWKNNNKKPFASNLREAYQNESDYNVIAVDWSAEAYSPLYIIATKSVPEIANVVASLIDLIVVNYNGSLDKMHLIGHSLGAHIAGLAGTSIKSSGRIARVTGLDPAFPSIKLTTAQNFKESAAFVDVIHTCGGILSFIEPMGHADFYPNGGAISQPGCGFRDLYSGVGSCSHQRAHLYFTESITSPTSFVATQCDTYELFKNSGCADNEKDYMGESVSTSARGKYFLKTNEASPYGLGDDS